MEAYDGQAYDGASAMSADISGVQARILELSPLALYTHCRSYVLNLSIATTCKVPEVRKHDRRYQLLRTNINSLVQVH